MELKLERYIFYNDTTIGKLYVNGVLEAYTLEDKTRPVKIYGKTAIPAGLYSIVVNHSPKFGRRLPLLQNVTGYTGIRLHSGNNKDDTAGCILPGTYVQGRSVRDSRKAFNHLFDKIDKAYKTGKKITIEITETKIPEKKTYRKILGWSAGAGTFGLLAFFGIRKLIQNHKRNEISI